MILHGKHVLLRPPRYDEHRRLVRLRNENCHWFFDQKPITLESHLAWYDSQSKTGVKPWSEPSEFYCIMVVGHVIGTISLMGIDCELKRAEYGRFLIAAGMRRRGYGSDALATVLHHAFFDLDMECVYGEVLAHNEAALALDRKLGFRDHGSRSIVQDRVAICMRIRKEQFIEWLATSLS